MSQLETASGLGVEMFVLVPKPAGRPDQAPAEP
jgi:hypothetical protein